MNLPKVIKTLEVFRGKGLVTPARIVKEHVPLDRDARHLFPLLPSPALAMHTFMGAGVSIRRE